MLCPLKWGDLAEHTVTIGCQCKINLHFQCVSYFLIYNIGILVCEL